MQTYKELKVVVPDLIIFLNFLRFIGKLNNFVWNIFDPRYNMRFEYNFQIPKTLIVQGGENINLLGKSWEKTCE